MRSNSKSSIATVYQVREDFKHAKRRNQKLSPTPVNVIIWAMQMLGGPQKRVPMNQLQTYIKKNFTLPCPTKDVNRKIKLAVRYLIYFGVIDETPGGIQLKKTSLTK